MTRHADHDRRRQNFARAAFMVLARNGLAGLTVREVAKEAGYTTGALVHYYPSKDELFIAASEYTATIVRPLMEQEEAAFPGVEGLRQVIYEALPKTPAARALWSVWLVFWEKAQQNDAIGRIARERYAEWHGRLRRLVKKAQAAGEIDSKANATILAHSATVLVDGIAVQALRTETGLSAKRQKSLVDLWIAGLPR